MLDARVRAVLAQLHEEDQRERAEGVPQELRSRAVAPTTGQFLFALAAANAGCEVLELGGSRGYSTLWLAAGARILGGRVVSIEQDPRKCVRWRQSVADAGLEEWATLLEGDALQLLAQVEDGFDVIFLDAEKEAYEALFALARPKLDAGGLVVADNVLSHVDALGAYSAARQADPTLSSVTVPLDRGLELTTLLA